MQRELYHDTLQHMIRQITGTVVGTEDRSLHINTGALTYRVYVSDDLIHTYGTTEEPKVTLHTHHAIREDSQDLYGFAKREDLVFFEQIISVSGIGPKKALLILSLASSESLASAIARGDVAYLTQVPGVGRKNAEKIILELKDKVIDREQDANLRTESDLVEAMQALGYGPKESRDALQGVPKEITETAERLKHALRNMKKS